MFGLEYADVGGRLASVLLNLGVLFLLGLYMRRRNRLWGNYLLLVSTPMAVFLDVVVNPSGWEITCGLVMAVALSEAAWGRLSVRRVRGLAEEHHRVSRPREHRPVHRPTSRVPVGDWSDRIGLRIGPLETQTRPAAHGRGGRPGHRRGRSLVSLTHQYGVAAPSTFPGLVRAFADTLHVLPGVHPAHVWSPRLAGHADSRAALVLNVAAWAVLLTRLPSIRKAAIACGVFGIVVVPCAISASVWAAWPLWWQGRYGMPFALGFVLLLLLRSGRLIPRMVSTVSGISLLSLGIMVWVNEIRYGFGLDGFGCPYRSGLRGSILLDWASRRCRRAPRAGQRLSVRAGLQKKAGPPPTR